MNVIRIIFYVVMVALVGTGVAMYVLNNAGDASNGGGTSIDQSRVCVVESDQDAVTCEEGSSILARFTDSEPAVAATRIINTAALYCDTNYQITTTATGVFCVLTHERIPER